VGTDLSSVFTHHASRLRCLLELYDPCFVPDALVQWLHLRAQSERGISPRSGMRSRPAASVEPARAAIPAAGLP
jgi:hypothetical protein